MSRVYDTPRYSDQTLNKVLLHLELARIHSGVKSLMDRFGNKRIHDKNLDRIKHELQQLELIDADEIYLKTPEDMDDVDLFDQYYLGDAVMRPGYEQLSRTIATGRALAKILELSSVKKIYCDSDATIRMTHGYLKGKYTPTLSDKDSKMTNLSSVMARDIVVSGLAACRVGDDVVHRVKRDLVSGSMMGKEWRAMYCWNRGMELMRLKSMTPEVHDAHDRLRGYDMEIAPECFDISMTRAVRTLGAEHAYRIMGMYVIEYPDNIYILDFPSLDQVHQVSKMWEGFYKYASNYRVSGSGLCKREIDVSILNSLREWIVQALEQSGYSDMLPRSMKQSLALLQNDIHAEAERLDVNLQLKSTKLKAMISEIIPMKEYWHDKLRSIGVTARVQLDLANMFYALPAPDCDLTYLFERASTYMSQANTANPRLFHEFMQYCMAIDFCKAVTIYRKDVSYGKAEGYEFEEEPWYKACLRGNLKLPNDSDMGKVWVENHFPFNNTLPTWFWEAADVTHVLSDAQHYESLKVFNNLPRSSHNELLYALENAPSLSYNWDPKNLLEQLCEGDDKWDRMAVMAVKCENTKPGKKCRETWSADDITRELTSCYDRAAIPVAAMYKGVTARKSAIEVSAIFDRICYMTRRDSKGKVIIMSNDVSGWSPLGDRDAWSRHHDYLVGMTKAPEGFKLKRIWKGISAYLAKRGLLAHAKLDKGLFQGWTGTCDSIFNVHISLFCVRQAKRAGLLLSSEAANTAGLIDDAVQAVELDPDSTLEHQQAAADAHFGGTSATWKGLGAELDTVKTIYSSSKFIYLNRFFCEGSEVLTPMKIFARSDREFNRRYAAVFSQFDTILGAYKSSVDKGMCPITAYYFSIEHCVRTALYANYNIQKYDMCSVVNAAFAPRGLGGWGFPHIVAWLTQEAQDSLSMYTTIMCSLIDIVTDETVKERFNTHLMGTIGQNPKIVGIMSLISTPRDVQVAGVIRPEDQVSAKIKKGMLRRCKSGVFRRALEMGTSGLVTDALEKVVKSCRWDVSILELLQQCLPSTCSAALVDRAYKNEMVTQLFPFRVRSELSSIIRKGGGYAVEFLLSKSKGFQASDVLGCRAIAYDLAMTCRSRFYEENGIEITNHTIPDYGTCLARQYVGENPGIIVRSKWPVHSCVSDKDFTSNMYDGMTGKDKSKIPKSVSAYTFTGERYRYMNPVQRCVSKAAVVSAYLASEGGHGKAFWDMVMFLWGAETYVAPPVVTVQIKPGTSTKRLGSATTHLTHAISAFPNVHNSIEVDADPIGVYLSMKSTHVDYMSLVTSARTIGLLNLSCCRDGQNLEDMYFGFLEGSIPVTEEDKLVVFDEETYNTGLREIVENSDKSFFYQVLESMKDVQYSRDANEEYTCIGFRDEHLGSCRMGQEVSIAAGYLSNIINCAIVMPTATRKQSAMLRVAGDEILARPTLKADTRMRRLIKVVPRGQAVMCLAMETVRDLCAGPLQMTVAQAPWRHVAEEYRLAFPAWEAQWENVSHLIRRYTVSVDINLARALLGSVPHHILNHLCSIDARANDSSLCILSYLYLASYGRLRTPESYTMTSAMGTQQMSRVWGLAAQVRTKPSRKWKLLVTKERSFMGQVYHALSLACQAFYTKLGVAQAFFRAIYQQLLFTFKHEPRYFPPCDERLLCDAPSRNPHWARTRNQLLDCCREVRLDIEYLTREFDQIMGDIYVIGDVQVLKLAAEEAVLLEPREHVQAMALPKTGRVVDRGDPKEETTVTRDDRLIAAASAYIDHGLHYALQVYEGIEEYEYDYVPTDEEISDFLSELQFKEEALTEGQIADEV